MAAAICASFPAIAPPLGAQARQWTLEELFRRNVGTKEQQHTAFPPHRIIDNIYYIGTESLASFLVDDGAGSDPDQQLGDEANVPVLRGSVEQLGFKFADVKIVLGSHAHGDHMEGDALIKELTGAQVMAMNAL